MSAAAAPPPVHPFEVIDGYTHCGLSKYYPYETLRGVLDAAGVSRVVIVQHMGEYDNAYLGGLTREHPDTVACVGLVNHRDPRARDQLAELAEGGDLKGVRLTSEMMFERPELVMAAAHLGLIIQAMPHHAPADWVPYLEAAIARHPETRVMLSHLATPRLQDAPDFAPQQPVWDLARHPGVMFQLSFPSRYAPHPHEPVYPVIAQAVEAFGAERIVWGSNYPASGGLDEYLADLMLLLDGKLPVPDEAIEAIAGGNARRFWFGED